MLQIGGQAVQAQRANPGNRQEVSERLDRSDLPVERPKASRQARSDAFEGPDGVRWGEADVDPAGLDQGGRAAARQGAADRDDHGENQGAEQALSRASEIHERTSNL